MGFKLLDVQKFIKEKNAKPVITGENFIKNNGILEPNPDGLYSKQIFGHTLTEQREKFGYIDLKSTVMHPLIYNNISKISSEFKQCLDKTKSFIIKDGELILVADNEGKNGLSWLIKEFHKINFDKYKNGKNDDFIEFLKKVNKQLIFIDKIPVIPIIYRPYRINKGRVEEDEITDLYKKILFDLNNTNLPTNNAVDLNDVLKATLDKNDTVNSQEKLQKKVINIYKYFINKLEKKEGFFRSKLIGKRLDNVSRLVANARPDVPIDCIVIPWHVLLNLFDVYVIAMIHKDTENNYKEKLGLTQYSMEDLGKHLYYIYKNCDIYCKSFPEKQDIWIEILKKIFEEYSYLRVLMKRDPGWNASSFWTLKPIIGKGCQYQCIVPSFYYIPLGGDSFNTNVYFEYQPDKSLNLDMKFYNGKDEINYYEIKQLKSVFNNLKN